MTTTEIATACSSRFPAAREIADTTILCTAGQGYVVRVTRMYGRATIRAEAPAPKGAIFGASKSWEANTVADLEANLEQAADWIREHGGEAIL